MDSADALPEGLTGSVVPVSQFGKFARVARGGGAWRRPMYDLNYSAPEARENGRRLQGRLARPQGCPAGVKTDDGCKSVWPKA